MADYPQQTSGRADSQAEATASSPPSKRDLASWWKQFKRNTRKVEPKEKPRGIFGVPLNVSIKYANVAISVANDIGESFIYGYVPIVVAKCGIFLKEKATDVEGIFRLSGSAKRIKDLQDIFDSPDRYGKNLDWTGYTVHDAANVLRRFFNQLPEPIVPLEFYDLFRRALSRHMAYVQGLPDPYGVEGRYDHAWLVATYQDLIRQLPPLNKHLLLYILDLLAVFASKCDQNLMTAANLAAIFQPGLLSHPQHDMAPDQYKLSQDVLVFLIENQDHFLFGMNGTAADEQTVKEVEAGAPPRAAHHSSSVRRSVSSASGGAEGLRKSVNLRRNVSASSRRSRASNNAVAPGTPTSLTGGVLRSNTLPSKMSPAASAPRYGKPTDALHTHAPAVQQSDPQTRRDPPPPPPSAHDVGATSPPAPEQQPSTAEKPRLTEGLPMTAPVPAPLPIVTPTRERKLSSFFTKSPPPNGDARDLRQPNRLRKKRIPGSASESAQSSSHSLQAATADPGVTSAARLTADSQDANAAELTPRPVHPVTPGEEEPSEIHYESPRNAPSSGPGDAGHSTLRPHGSRTPSMNSRSSFTDHSDLDQGDDPSQSERKRRSWRFPRSSKRSDEHIGLGLGSPPRVAVNGGVGEVSNDSRSSSRQASKVVAGDLPPSGRDPSHQPLSLDADVRRSSLSKEGSPGSDSEKMSFFGKIKAKVAQVRDGSREKETDRERMKSPSPADEDKAIHRSSVPPDDSPAPNATGASAEAPHEPKDDPAHGIPAASGSSQPTSGMPPAIPEEPATPDREQAAPSGAAQEPVASTTAAETAATPELATVVEHASLEDGKGGAEVSAQ